MSSNYDPYLDNNYRIVGDRIMSERTYQSSALVALVLLCGGALLGYLNRAFAVHPNVRFLLAGGVWLAVIFMVPADELGLNGTTAIVVVLGALAGVVAYYLATVCITAIGALIAYRFFGVGWAIGVVALSVLAGPPLTALWDRYAQRRAAERAAANAADPEAAQARQEREKRKEWGTAIGGALLIVFYLAKFCYIYYQRHHDAPQPARPSVTNSGAAAQNDLPAEKVPAISHSITPSPHAVVADLSSESVPGLQARMASGDVGAATELGVRYLNGKSVGKDYKSAIGYLAAAAKQGDPRALTNLGWMLTLGQGVSRDDAMAMNFFRAAAEKGFPNAQDSLGYMYEHGRGVAMDLDIAASWYRKAADQGFSKSKLNLQRLFQQ